MMSGCRHSQQPLDVRFSHHRETGSPPGALRRVADVLFDIVGFGRDARAAVPGADSAAGAYYRSAHTYVLEVIGALNMMPGPFGVRVQVNLRV